MSFLREIPHKISFLLVGLFALPVWAYALNPNVLKTVVPQAGGCPLGYGAFFKLIQNALNDAVVFAVIAAVLLIAYAGFLFVFSPASPEGISKGKTVLMNTVIGFVIVLAAWLIVSEFVTVFTTGSMTSFTQLLNPSSKGYCLIPTSSVSGSKTTANLRVSKTTVPTGKELTVRKELAAADIGVNNYPCPANSNGQGCTDVGGLKSNTIQQIIALAQASGVRSSCKGGNDCKIVITGGNEPGYPSGTYSHADGYEIDVRLGSPLDTFIEKFKFEGTHTGSTPVWTDPCNAPTYNPDSSNKYIKKSDHWDIRVTSFCGFIIRK